MTKFDRSLIACVLAAGLVAAGCGDDDADVMPGIDAGPMEDGGGPGMDSGPGEDAGPGVDGGPTGCPAIEDRTVVTVDADITADETWTCDNLYVLDAQIFVRAVLTVEPGVVVQGSAGANAIIVTTMGRIEAEGTAAEPIVFTSSADRGDRVSGDWGGVVLLGLAPINVAGGTNNIEGIDPGEDKGSYGGDDASHDCGTLKYVRIEFAGFVFGTDNELNGLTVGGCGSDTTLDYIQVHAGKDDGIEFFGGTADLRHAVVTHVVDDSLDTDQGYQGTVQYFIAQQLPGAGNRTFEMDNLGADNEATPRSTPKVWNATLVGGAAADQQAMRLREGTAGDHGNIIAINFDMEPCITIQHNATIEELNDGNLVVQNSIVNGCASDEWFRYDPSDTDPVSATVDLEDSEYGNQVGVDPMLEDPTNVNSPNWAPASGADLTTGAGTPPSGLDASATYIGAIDPEGDDWTAGWTAYPAD